MKSGTSLVNSSIKPFDKCLWCAFLLLIQPLGYLFNVFVLFCAVLWANSNEHPNSLFLLLEEVAYQWNCCVIVCLRSNFDNSTLTSNQCLVVIEKQVESLFAATNNVSLFDFSSLQIYTETALWSTTQLKDTLCNFINLLCSIVVKLLILAMQYKETMSLYVPVEITEVAVEYLKICQQNWKFIYYVLYFLFV